MTWVVPLRHGVFSSYRTLPFWVIDSRIVAHEVSNSGSDRRQLANMTKQAKAAIATEELTAVADRGYYRGEDILNSDKANITSYLPKPNTSGNQAKGQFGRDAFRYSAEDNEYECPAGLRLVQHSTT